MPPRPPSSITPAAVRIDVALEASEPLARLRHRLGDSAARFEAVRGNLPGGLADHVTAGPVDEKGWSLLAANAAVAAKLRQLRPRIEAALRDAGWVPCAVRVKTVPPAGGRQSPPRPRDASAD